jgi:hypothetical protein
MAVLLQEIQILWAGEIFLAMVEGRNEIAGKVMMRRGKGINRR